MNVATVLQAAASLVWVAVIGLIVLAVVRSSRGQKIGATSTTIVVLAIIAVLLTSLSAGLVFIQPEYHGVVISAVADGGYRKEPLKPGLHWVIPFLETVERYPIYRQTYTMSIAPAEGQIKGDDSILARTADGQEVTVDASVIFQIIPEQVVNVHIAWQDRYANDLVRPLARGVIRDAISQFGIEEVYSSKRTELSQLISDQMDEKLRQNGLMLVSFILRNITFSPEYAASVEQKQIAEQLAEQARFTVEQRRQEAEQARQVAQGQADAAVINAKGSADARIIQAQAEAKSLELLAAALQQNQDLLTYTYINKITPGIQVMLLPSNSPFLFPLPTMGPTQAATSSAQPTPSPTPAPTTTP